MSSNAGPRSPLSPLASTVLAAVLALAAVGALAGPAVLGGERILASRDLFHYYYPMKARLVAAFEEGRYPPLWEPTVACGVPYLADPSTSTLYPASLLHAVLPLAVTFNLMILAHAGIAAAGAAAYARALGAGGAGAIVAGLVYALNGVALSFHNHPLFLQSGAWLPVALLAFRRLCEAAAGTARARWVAATAGAIALLFLGGGAEIVFAAAFLLAIEAVAAMLRLCREGTGTKVAVARSFGLLAAGGTLAIALVSAQLLPAVELARASDRTAGAGTGPGGLALETAGAWSFHPAQSPDLVAPFFYGNQPRDGTYRGRGLVNSPAGDEPLTASSYFGPIVLVLAAAGLAASRPRGVALRHGALAAAFFVLALGLHTPAFALLHRFLPGFALFRYPGKLLYLLALPLAVLAALGVRAFEDGGPVARRTVRIGSAALTLAFAAALLYPWDERPRSATEGLVHGLGAISVAAGIAFGLRGRLAAAAVALVLAADLALASRGLFISVPRALLDEPPPAAATIAKLAADEGGAHSFRVGRLPLPADPSVQGDFVRLRERHRATLQPNLASRFGLHSFDHFGAVRLASYEALWRRLKDRLPFLLDLVSARFVLAADERGQLGWQHRPSARPRAFLADAGGAGKVRIVSYAPERVECECEADAPRRLVLLDTFYPGWLATVDGREAPIERYEGAFRAVAVPAGPHRVVFELRPATFRLGLVVSAAGFLILCTLLCFGRRPRDSVSDS